jgi:hypothetical protein
MIIRALFFGIIDEKAGMNWFLYLPVIIITRSKNHSIVVFCPLIARYGRSNTTSARHKPNLTAAKIVWITIPGNGMVTKNTSVTVEKKEPSPRGEGLNQTERSILIQSTERHDKALKKLSKL